MDFECNRKPRRCSHDRTTSSGFVSFDLIRLITRLLSSSEIVSISPKLCRAGNDFYTFSNKQTGCGKVQRKFVWGIGQLVEDIFLA